jgi:hypothetical protein
MHYNLKSKGKKKTRKEVCSSKQRQLEIKNTVPPPLVSFIPPVPQVLLFLILGVLV